VIQVEAVEWNCPQHITPRFTEKEVQGFVLKYQTELEELRAKLKQTQAQAQVENPKEIGTGPLELVVSGVRQLSSRVRAYELRRPSGEDLPVVSAGAHLRVPVMLEDGKFETRQYSISSNPARRDIYEIAVQLDAGGTGGSKAVHRLYDVGTRLNCDLPLNHFALKEGEHPVVLIAGGIGITPIKAMAQTLSAKQRSFVLHYAGKRYNDMAYRDRLQREFGAAMHVYASDRGEHMRVTDMLSKASIDTMFYVCGPEPSGRGGIGSGETAGYFIRTHPFRAVFYAGNRRGRGFSAGAEKESTSDTGKKRSKHFTSGACHRHCSGSGV
jgi:hypothetical protein